MEENTSMRNILAFFGAAILVLLGVGYYLGWYSITPQKTNPGQTRLQVDINQDKANQDVHKGLQKGGEKLQEVLDKNKQNAPAGTDKSGGDKTPAPNAGDAPPAKTAARAGEALHDLINDGWTSGDKK
jgi:hypothetical protein